MTPMRAFASRNTKETLRDPLNMLFTLAFPIFLILMMTFIQNKAPEAIFPIDRLSTGMALFGLAFITLNTSLLIGQDRSSSFLSRLFSSPLGASDFIWGYSLPQLAIAVGQSIVCMGVSVLVGLPLSWNILWALLTMLPSALMFVGFGMLFGSLLTDKQAGGICSVFINLAAFTSGLWIPLDLVGGVFGDICNLLPFAHAFEMAKGVLAGDFGAIFPHIWWVLGYTVAAMVSAILVFRRKMRG